jgi:hypothetical protein
MSTWHLVLREIGYRKGNFLLAAAAVLVAAACVVAAISLLARDGLRSEQWAAEQDKELKEQKAKLEDDYRKIALGLGFNLVILPKDQELHDFYDKDYASKSMPEDYAERLAKARVVTVNHVLPTLQQRIKWPEQDRTIQLVGTRGEVALVGRGKMTALQAPVPAGQAVLGYELHRSLKLAKGDRIVLRGRTLQVSALQSERGNKDDITVWVPLAEAQQLLGQPGRINAIMALECNCASDRLATVRSEIAKVLPDTQVIEFGPQALARAEARNRAADEADQDFRREAHSRAQQSLQRERLFAVLIPLVVGATAIWVGLLAWGNVRSRTGEIGILRALGVPTRRVLALFLVRAALLGVLGAALGFAAGWLGSWLGEERLSGGPPLGPRFDPLLLALVLVITPLLSALVSWLPALAAAQVDPAATLRT